MLGIPIPSLFMATNSDNTWEVVDGLQRLSSIIKFAGSDELRKSLNLGEPLELTELQKLTSFEGLTFARFPLSLQQHFWTRPIKVITLNDKSDSVVRYDLFERLNTGGIALSPQEIRDCVFRGSFADKLDELAKEPNFHKVVRLTTLQQRDGSAAECVLRFFAFNSRYKKFDHNVTDFLNDYMEDATHQFDYEKGEALFKKTFSHLAKIFPNGIRRPGGKHTTPLNLFEGISVGAALVLAKSNKLAMSQMDKWMASAELRSYTTGATNDRKAVMGRIEFCRDRFLGKPYNVQSAST